MDKTGAFREKITPEAVTTTTQVAGDDAIAPQVNEEAPFTDYQKVNHHPFLVDYFQLGDTWRDKMGGFETEIELIEGYFKDRAEQGHLKNETPVIKEEIKKIYKLCGIDRSERTTMQIEKLAAYIKFLKDTDKITLNSYRYQYR